MSFVTKYYCNVCSTWRCAISGGCQCPESYRIKYRFDIMEAMKKHGIKDEAFFTDEELEKLKELADQVLLPQMKAPNDI